VTLLRPIFHEFGITEIIATNAEVKDGHYTGKVAGTACYQQGKLVRLAQWLDGREVTESWAYSDSINDRFLLEYATHAIAVNPDDRLEKLAKEQAWEIQDWSI
jgi:phosphoserine phosphatase